MMIKKSIFEDELIRGMQLELQAHDKKQGMQNLVKAAEYLQSALEIFEEAGLNSKADQVLNILEKIALDSNNSKGSPHTVNDSHTNGLTPDKMTKNLQQHGTVFNMADDNKSDDLLNAEVKEQPIEVSDDPNKTFEDSD
jgi:hypothetical protein